MIRVTGRYENRTLQLDEPLALDEGVEVIFEIRQRDEVDAWSEVSAEAFDAAWNNPEDAVYDDWRKLYGLEAR